MLNDIRTCPQCGATLGSSALGDLCLACVVRVTVRPMLAPADATVSSADGAAKAGLKSFGDYELLEQIGEGGMGVVFKARQVKLRRLVALKMIRDAQFASATERQRFQAEAEAAALLDHPHIVPIYEVGECLGRPFLSMKLMEGGTLARWMDGQARLQPGNPPGAEELSRRVTLATKIVRAVQHAHQGGLLHRDLKPANILLDAQDEPFVSDFGLARKLDVLKGQTLSGAVLGTPGYMAPEQAAGQVRRLTTTADVFSLGAILYHLLTGRAAFQADSFAEAIRQVAEVEPTKPSALNPNVDRDLETICLKCLEKDPQRRYPAAGPLADDLERWRRHEVIHARPSTSVEQLLKWARRRPAIAVLSTLLLVSLIGGIFGITLKWREAVVERERADHQTGLTQEALNQARNALWQAQFDRARAQRQTGFMGQRVKALEAIRAAAAIRRTPELRNEAIAALALPDFSEEDPWHPLPAGTVRFVMEPGLELYAIANGTNRVSVHQSGDDRELFFVEDRLLIEPELEFTPDGRFLVAYKEWMIRVWNATNGATVLALDFPDRAIRLRNLTVSGDSRRFCYSDLGNRMRIYDLDPPALKLEINNLDRPWRAAFHPRTNLLAIDCTREVQLWDLNERRVIKKADVPPNMVGALQWSNDGRLLAIGLMDSRILVWDVGLNQTMTLTGHTREIVNLWFHPQDQTLLSTAWDNTVRLWDPVTGTQLLQAGGIIPRGFSRDGDKLVVWKQPGGFGTFSVQLPAVCRLLATAPKTAPMSRLEFSHDSRLLLGANTAGPWLWRTDTGKLAAIGNLPQTQYAAFLEAGSVLTAGRGGLHVWPVVCAANEDSVSLGSPLRSPFDLKLPLGVAALNSDRRRLAVHLAGTDQATVLNLERGGQVLELRALRDFAWPVFSPCGRWIAAGCWNPTITKPMFATIWDASTGQAVTNFATTKCTVTFSPDGRWLLLGANTEYRLMETATWKQVRSFERQDAVVSNGHAAFSPDGNLLALHATDRILRLVNPHTGEELARLTSPDNRVLEALSFSPDGRWLAAATEANVQLWDLLTLRRELAALGLDW